MGILTKKVRTTQPQGAVLAAPISSRAYGFLLGDSSPELFGSNTVVTYTGTTKSVGLTGVTRNFVGASSHNGSLPTPAWVDPATPWAAVAVFKCDTIGVSQKIACWTGNGVNVQIHLGGSTSLSITSETTTGTIGARASSLALTSGVTYRICVGFDGTSYFIYNGGAISYIPPGYGIGTDNYATTTYIGSRGGSSGYFTGDITLFAYIQGNVDAQSLSANPWQLFPHQRGLLAYASALVSLPTIAYAASTTSAGAWTSTAGTLSAAINESVASDAEYISVASGSTCEMVLDNTAFPGGASQTLSYRASSVNSSSLTVELKQGATTIMTRTHALTPTITLYTQTLTSGEIATIIAGPISVTLTSS